MKLLDTRLMKDITGESAGQKHCYIIERAHRFAYVWQLERPPVDRNPGSPIVYGRLSREKGMRLKHFFITLYPTP